MEITEMYKIRDIFRLVSENQSCRIIAKTLNIGKSTANYFTKKIKELGLKYNDIIELSDPEILELLEMGKANNSEKYKYILERFPYYEKELKKVGVNIKVLWEEYICENPAGYSFSQFSHHFQIWRGSTKSSMHIEHKAGDKMFVDFTGKKLFLTDIKTEEKNEVEIFISVLGASNMTYVEAVESQNKKDFIKCVENSLWYFGGTPKAIVPDNLKAAVNKASKYEPEINRDFHDFAKHYNTVILPTRTYSAKDKATVENAVKIVYSWIFAKLRNKNFYSIIDLNKEILSLLTDYNNKKMQRIKMSRLELFNEIEKNVLKPLPFTLFEYKKYSRLTVAFNYHIYLSCDGHYYSVPFSFTKKKVDVCYSETNVEIYYDNIRIASHKRAFNPNKYSTNPAHMPPKHQFYASWTPERFLSWAEKIGYDVKEFIKGVLDSKEHPEQGFKVSLGILNLSKSYGNEKLNKACKKGSYYKVYTLNFIKNILSNNRFEIESENLFQKSFNHENIRGEQYYN
jgi:transposase